MEKEMLAGLLDHAEWIVFALILANQAGIPVFAAPALLAVGALAWTGDVNVAIAIAGAMGVSRFLAHDCVFQLGARFLPELNPVTAAFAGVAGVGLRRFVLGAAVSAGIWAGTWIGVGYLIASTTWSGGSGIPVFSVVVAAAALASMAVGVRSGARGVTLVVRFLRTKASARPGDASLPADDTVARRRSAC